MPGSGAPLGSPEATFHDRKTLLRRFVDQGALGPDTARSCVGIGRDLSDRTAALLRTHGFLRQPPGTDRFWVPEEGLDALRRWEANDYPGHLHVPYAGPKGRRPKGAPHMSEPLLTPEMTGLADQLDADWREVRKALSGPMATVEGLTRAEAALTRLFGTRATSPDRLRSVIHKRLADAYVEAAEEALKRRGLLHGLTLRQQREARVAQTLGVALEDFITEQAQTLGLQAAAA